MKPALPTASVAYGLNGPSATAIVDNATPAGLLLSSGKNCPNKRDRLYLHVEVKESDSVSLSFERLYPWLFGLMAAGIWTLCDLELPSSSEKLIALLSASISVSAILVGFLATMKSIVMAMPGVTDRLRQAGYLDLLAKYLLEGTAANLAFCVLNIAGFFTWSANHLSSYSTLWFALGIAGLASFWRVTRIMVLVLTWNRAG